MVSHTNTATGGWSEINNDTFNTGFALDIQHSGHTGFLVIIMIVKVNGYIVVIYGCITVWRSTEFEEFFQA